MPDVGKLPEFSESVDIPHVISHPTDEQFLSGHVTSAENREWLESVESEFEKAFSTLDGMRLGVSVFGSARTAPEHPRYALGVEVGRRIAEAGFTVITGGGPGLMQAANQGAAEAGARSVGLTIELPHEEEPNPYASTVVPFEHFFVRKTVFVRYSCAFVVLPGGFGTLDELFESLTLIQTSKLHDFPVILIGTEFWSRGLEWLRESLLAEGTISQRDLDLITMTDDLDEMISIIRSCIECHTPPGGVED